MTTPGLNPREVNEIHKLSDKDVSREAQHHSLGINPYQASPGDHDHDGRNSKLLATSAPEVVTGSRGGNAALASLLTALANKGIITDSTTV